MEHEAIFHGLEERSDAVVAPVTLASGTTRVGYFAHLACTGCGRGDDFSIGHHTAMTHDHEYVSLTT